MMNPAYRKLLGKDRSTSETGHGSDEAMDGALFRNVVGFLGRPTTIDRCVDAMRHLQKYIAGNHTRRTTHSIVSAPQTVLCRVALKQMVPSLD
jgi:hypothetical protein